MTLARQAQARQAYLASETLYTQALEQIDDTDDRQVCAAAQGRGVMRLRLARHDDSLKDLVLARERAEKLGDVEKAIELMIDEATVADWVRDTGRLTAVVERAHVAAKALGAPSPLVGARLLLGAALCRIRTNDGEGGMGLALEAAAKAEPLGDAGYETFAVASVLAAFEAAVLGRTEDAERVSQRALEAAERRGDVLHVASALNDRAPLWHARNDIDRFMEDTSRILTITRESGLYFMEYYALSNLGETEYAIGALDDARAHTRSAIDLATRIWGPDALETSDRQLLLARLEFYAGKPGEAAALFDTIGARMAAARAAGRSDDLFPSSTQSLFDMLHLALQPHDESAWDSLCERALTNNPQVQERMELLEFRAIGDAARGAHALARRHLEEALTLGPTQLLGRRVIAHLRRLPP
jgi:tetratricopeptide (TPR) repeat protein